MPLPKPHIDVEAKPRGSTAAHPGGSTKIAGSSTKKKAPSKSLGLFDEDNDSDVGDIFSVTTKPSAKKVGENNIIVFFAGTHFRICCYLLNCLEGENKMNIMMMNKICLKELKHLPRCSVVLALCH